MRYEIPMLFVVWTLMIPAWASADVEILVTGDITGRLARLDCRDGAQGGLPAIASTRAAREGSILLDNGNLVGTDGFGRFVLSSDAAALGALVADTGYDAVGIGMRELAADPAKLEEYMKAARERGVQFVSANLACGEKPSPACGLIVKSVRIEREGFTLGVTSVIDGSVLEQVPPRHRKGWTVTDPIQAAQEQIDAFGDDVDAIVVLSHLERRATAPRRTWELARQTSGWNAIVGNAFTEGPEGDGTLQMMTLEESKGVVAGTQKYAYRVTLLDLTEGAPSAQLIEPDAPEESDVSKSVSDWASRYCTEYNVPIAGAKFDGTWTPDDLRTFSLHVMREVTHAEVALINRDHLRVGDNTLTGDITKNLLFRSFAFSDPIGTVKISGADLKKIASVPQLDSVGMSEDGAKVNGRAIEDSGKYVVALTRFLAEGGDGLLPAQPGFVELREAGEPVVLRDAVIGHLENERPNQVVKPTEGFLDLSRRPLWTLYADAQVALDSVSIRNGDDYAESGQTQLTQTAFAGQSYRGSGKALLDTQRIAWHNQLDFKYAQSLTEGGDPIESADSIHFNSIFHERYFKAKWSRLSPVPYAELDIDSELTTANPHDPQPTDFHHFLTTGTVGVRSEVVKKVDVYLGVGVQSELLQDNPRGKFGIGAGYKLQPIELTQKLNTKTTFESSLGYFRADLGGDSTDRVTWTNKLNVLIFGYLTAGVAFDAFAYRDEAIGSWGTSTQLTFTLGAAWSDRVQTY